MTNEEVMRVIDNTKNVPKGIFQYLDEAVKSNRADGGFLVAITDAMKNSPLYSKNKLKNDKFTIYHSCYPVEYTVRDFVEKGKDELPANLLGLIEKQNPKIGKIIQKTISLAMDNTKMITYCD